MPTVDPTIPDEYFTLMKWADKVRTLKVRTNADTPKDAAKAREFGAEGIGLCRTEHMFFGDQRIVAMRKMILADDVDGRKAALAELEPFQKQDFIGIFEAMDGLPVTIRPARPAVARVLATGLTKEQAEVAALLGVGVFRRFVTASNSSTSSTRCSSFRGCRLPIVYPEIGDIWVTGGCIQAAIEVRSVAKKVLPEIMIPLVGVIEELTILKKRAIAVIQSELKNAGIKVEYQIGTMIEVPAPPLIAGQIALEGLEFFSFGTNDLSPDDLWVQPRRHQRGSCRLI